MARWVETKLGTGARAGGEGESNAKMGTCPRRGIRQKVLGRSRSGAKEKDFQGVDKLSRRPLSQRAAIGEAGRDAALTLRAGAGDDGG